MQFPHRRAKLAALIGLYAIFVRPDAQAAGIVADGGTTTTASTAAPAAVGHRDSTGKDRLSRGAAVIWATLHGIAKACPAFPDEQARMDKLDQVALSNGQDSAKTFIDRLDHDPKQQARFEADVQQIIKAAGGCDTDALRERQAEGRQLIDTYTQALAAPGGTLVVNWPVPALQEPIHVSVVRRGHDAQGREYLKLLLRNPSKEPVGVALAGKELRAGLCFDLTSAELPITQQSYRAIQFAHLAPGDSLSANLTFSADCFDDLDEAALMGTLILETSTGNEYRAIAVLGIRD